MAPIVEEPQSRVMMTSAIQEIEDIVNEMVMLVAISLADDFDSVHKQYKARNKARMDAEASTLVAKAVEMKMILVNELKEVQSFMHTMKLLPEVQNVVIDIADSLVSTSAGAASTYGASRTLKKACTLRLHEHTVVHESTYSQSCYALVPCSHTPTAV